MQVGFGIVIVGTIAVLLIALGTPRAASPERAERLKDFGATAFILGGFFLFAGFVVNVVAQHGK